MEVILIDCIAGNAVLVVVVCITWLRLRLGVRDIISWESCECREESLEFWVLVELLAMLVLVEGWFVLVKGGP